MDGVFTWVDNSPVAFLDWGERQPFYVVYIRCVVMAQKVCQTENSNEFNVVITSTVEAIASRQLELR